MGKLEVISIQGQTAVTADTVRQKLRSPLRQFEDTSIHTLRDTVHTHKCCPALDISEMTLGGSGGGGGGGGALLFVGWRCLCVVCGLRVALWCVLLLFLCVGR